MHAKPDVPGYGAFGEENSRASSLELGDSSVDYSAGGLRQLRINQPQPPPPPTAPPRMLRAGIISETKLHQPESFAKAPSETGKPSRKQAVSKPEPFSAEWRRAGMAARPDDDADEDDVVVVGDVMDVDSLPDTPFANAASQSEETADGNNADEEMDDDWERAQLSRSGVRPESHTAGAADDEYARKEELLRMRSIIRAEEERVVSSRSIDALHVLLQEVQRTKEELADRQAHGEQKAARLQAARARCKENIERWETDMTEGRAQREFYESLTRDMSVVCEYLRENGFMLRKYRERVVEVFREHFRRVKTSLSGVDEFGRTRNDKLLDVELEEDAWDVLDGLLPESCNELCSISSVKLMFGRWRDRFPEDYEGVFGNAALGRVIGALAHAERDFRWLLHLPDAARLTAARVGDVSDFVQVYVSAAWRPRDKESCEEVGTIARTLKEAWSEEDEGEKFRDFIQAASDRYAGEIACCIRVGDSGQLLKCIRGGIVVAEIAGFDVGVEEFLPKVRRTWDSSGIEGLSEVLREVIRCDAISATGKGIAKEWLRDA